MRVSGNPSGFNPNNRIFSPNSIPPGAEQIAGSHISELQAGNMILLGRPNNNGTIRYVKVSQVRRQTGAGSDSESLYVYGDYIDVQIASPTSYAFIPDTIRSAWGQGNDLLAAIIPLNPDQDDEVTPTERLATTVLDFRQAKTDFAQAAQKQIDRYAHPGLLRNLDPLNKFPRISNQVSLTHGLYHPVGNLTFENLRQWILGLDEHAVRQIALDSRVVVTPRTLHSILNSAVDKLEKILSQREGLTNLDIQMDGYHLLKTYLLRDTSQEGRFLASILKFQTMHNPQSRLGIILEGVHPEPDTLLQIQNRVFHIQTAVSALEEVVTTTSKLSSDPFSWSQADHRYISALQSNLLGYLDKAKSVILNDYQDGYRLRTPDFQEHNRVLLDEVHGLVNTSFEQFKKTSDVLQYALLYSGRSTKTISPGLLKSLFSFPHKEIQGRLNQIQFHFPLVPDDLLEQPGSHLNIFGNIQDSTHAIPFPQARNFFSQLNSDLYRSVTHEDEFDSESINARNTIDPITGRERDNPIHREALEETIREHRSNERLQRQMQDRLREGKITTVTPTEEKLRLRALEEKKKEQDALRLRESIVTYNRQDYRVADYLNNTFSLQPAALQAENLGSKLFLQNEEGHLISLQEVFAQKTLMQGIDRLVETEVAETIVTQEEIQAARIRIPRSIIPGAKGLGEIDVHPSIFLHLFADPGVQLTSKTQREIQALLPANLEMDWAVFGRTRRTAGRRASFLAQRAAQTRLSDSGRSLSARELVQNSSQDFTEKGVYNELDEGVYESMTSLYDYLAEVATAAASGNRKILDPFLKSVFTASQKGRTPAEIQRNLGDLLGKSLSEFERKSNQYRSVEITGASLLRDNEERKPFSLYNELLDRSQARLAPELLPEMESSRFRTVRRFLNESLLYRGDRLASEPGIARDTEQAALSRLPLEKSGRLVEDIARQTESLLTRLNNLRGTSEQQDSARTRIMGALESQQARLYGFRAVGEGHNIRAMTPEEFESSLSDRTQVDFFGTKAEHITNLLGDVASNPDHLRAIAQVHHLRIGHTFAQIPEDSPYWTHAQGTQAEGLMTSEPLTELFGHTLPRAITTAEHDLLSEIFRMGLLRHQTFDREGIYNGRIIQSRNPEDLSLQQNLFQNLGAFGNLSQSRTQIEQEDLLVNEFLSERRNANLREIGEAGLSDVFLHNLTLSRLSVLQTWAQEIGAGLYLKDYADPGTRRVYSGPLSLDIEGRRARVGGHELDLLDSGEDNDPFSGRFRELPRDRVLGLYRSGTPRALVTSEGVSAVAGEGIQGLSRPIYQVRQGETIRHLMEHQESSALGEGSVERFLQFYGGAARRVVLLDIENDIRTGQLFALGFTFHEGSTLNTLGTYETKLRVEDLLPEADRASLLQIHTKLDSSTIRALNERDQIQALKTSLEGLMGPGVLIGAHNAHHDFSMIPARARALGLETEAQFFETLFRTQGFDTIHLGPLSGQGTSSSLDYLVRRYYNREEQHTPVSDNLDVRDVALAIRSQGEFSREAEISEFNPVGKILVYPRAAEAPVLVHAILPPNPALGRNTFDIVGRTLNPETLEPEGEARVQFTRASGNQIYTGAHFASELNQGNIRFFEQTAGNEAEIQELIKDKLEDNASRYVRRALQNGSERNYETVRGLLSENYQALNTEGRSAFFAQAKEILTDSNEIAGYSLSDKEKEKLLNYLNPESEEGIKDVYVRQSSILASRILGERESGVDQPLIGLQNRWRQEGIPDSIIDLRSQVYQNRIAEKLFPFERRDITSFANARSITLQTGNIRDKIVLSEETSADYVEGVLSQHILKVGATSDYDRWVAIHRVLEQVDESQGTVDDRLSQHSEETLRQIAERITTRAQKSSEFGRPRGTAANYFSQILTSEESQIYADQLRTLVNQTLQENLGPGNRENLYPEELLDGLNRTIAQLSQEQRTPREPALAVLDHPKLREQLSRLDSGTQKKLTQWLGLGRDSYFQSSAEALSEPEPGQGVFERVERFWEEKAPDSGTLIAFGVGIVSTALAAAEIGRRRQEAADRKKDHGDLSPQQANGIENRVLEDPQSEESQDAARGWKKLRITLGGIHLGLGGNRLSEQALDSLAEDVSRTLSNHFEADYDQDGSHHTSSSQQLPLESWDIRKIMRRFTG